MKEPLSLAACIVMTCQLAAAAEEASTRTPPRLIVPSPPAPAPPPKWLTDAKGCKFLNPAASANLQIATIDWEGACVDGFVHGPGVLTAGYITYRGDFSRGQLVKGTAQGGGYTFEGTFADNESTGETIVRMPDGTTVQGRFDHGRIDPPQAEISWPNGAHYRGGVEQSLLRMHGAGVLEYSNGAVYEGAFQDGRVEGAGVMKLANGEVRRGMFVDGELHGKGSIEYANRSRYEGELRAGELSGHGTLAYADGSRYEGQFASNQRHGAGKLTEVSGETYEGEWQGDALTGKCHIVLREGQVVYDGRCVNRRFDGAGTLNIGKTTVSGEFKRNALIRGSINTEDGRTFEIDVEKQQILEVEKDGTKHPIDQLPPDITI